MFEITKETYKKILDIQGVTYTEDSLWFNDSLKRINELLKEIIVQKFIDDVFNRK